MCYSCIVSIRTSPLPDALLTSKVRSSRATSVLFVGAALFTPEVVAATVPMLTPFLLNVTVQVPLAVFARKFVTVPATGDSIAPVMSVVFESTVADATATT
jgi:hypothetical protein